MLALKFLTWKYVLMQNDFWSNKFKVIYFLSIDELERDRKDHGEV
jgi:hypothetical protein